MASWVLIGGAIFVAIVIVYVIADFMGVKLNTLPNMASTEAKKDMKSDVKTVLSQNEPRIVFKKLGFNEVIKQIIIVGRDDKHNCNRIRFKYGDNKLSDFSILDSPLFIRVHGNPSDMMTSDKRPVWEIIDEDFVTEMAAKIDHAELKAKSRQIELEESRKTDKQRLRETAESVREHKRAMYGFIPQQGYNTGTYGSSYGRPWRVRPIGNFNNEESEDEQL